MDWCVGGMVIMLFLREGGSGELLALVCYNAPSHQTYVNANTKAILRSLHIMSIKPILKRCGVHVRMRSVCRDLEQSVVFTFAFAHSLTYVCIRPRLVSPSAPQHRFNLRTVCLEEANWRFCNGRW